MTYNNPHAVEGLFAKSRAVLNEAMVCNVFNGGEGALHNNPRDSLPLENFLIGNSCYETAVNYVQHVNKTVELNYTNLGLSQPPTIAYLDPYLSNADHARVLLFDVAHDREFIAFQDLHMQVQSSPMHAQIGWSRDVSVLTLLSIKQALGAIIVSIQPKLMLPLVSRLKIHSFAVALVQDLWKGRMHTIAQIT